MTVKHLELFGFLFMEIWILGALADNNSLNDSNHLPFGGYYCWVRCIGKCLEDDSLVWGRGLDQHDRNEVICGNTPSLCRSRSIENCENLCTAYKNDALCTNNTCWLSCKDLISGVQTGPDPPTNVTVSYGQGSYDPYNANLNWDSVPDAQLYVVQYLDTTDMFVSWAQGGSGLAETKLLEFKFRKPVLCPKFQFRIAAVNSKGVSQFSDIKTLDKPIPMFPNDVKVNLVSGFWYKEVQWIDAAGVLRDNATLYADLNFTMPPFWSMENFSTADLLVSNVQCSDPDLSRTYPKEKYWLDKLDPIIHMKTPAATMRQKCLVVLKLEGMRTVCGTIGTFPFRLISHMVNCDTVHNSPCNLPPKIQLPHCTVTKFDCNITDTGEQCDEGKLPANSSADVSISWEMLQSNSNKGVPLYYAVRWGPGVRPEGATQLLGVTEITSITQTLKTCTENGICNNSTNSIDLKGIPVGRLIAVQICAVYDKQYEFLDGKINRVSSQPIEIQVQEDKRGTPGYVIALAVCIPLGIALAFFFGVLCFLYKKQKTQDKEVMRLHHEMTILENENRYTELPRKHDIWELERRNLILYQDRKLGSGAFGSVFMGKIAGKVLGHKDSTSALATNLMRVENADVAVKMLPEYADEISKADFLKEINLMKQLGYHERLVNMMACITDSEPYCLIVEYCSDGDLLHFLRDRCKYMMKLDEQGIDYTNPEADDDVDTNFILSLKELLGFAVQCCVGLEYLSQKGFIHRDVAARNVLVHEKKYAKIGDFGLCRYVYGDDNAYWGKGGRLPIKWMSPEAIKSYEFTTKSDIWSFGVLLFEIITMGGCPYPGIQPADVEAYLENGGRMGKPDNCPDPYYDVMMGCWKFQPEQRLNFSQAREQLAKMLEETVVDYSYLTLDQQRDYYNVPYSEQGELAAEDGEPENLERVTMSFDNKGFEPITEEEPEMLLKVESRIVDQRHDSGLDMGTDSISVSSAEETPGVSAPPPVPPRRHHLDSGSSDRFLITPTEQETGEKNRFRFSFKGQQNLGHVPEMAENSDSFTDSGISPGVSNSSYTEFLIRNPPPVPPPRRDLV